MRTRGKDLAFSEPEVDLLLDIAYPDYRAFLLLSLLYQFVDLKNHFHVDHVFPRSMLTPSQLRKAGMEPLSADDLAARCNRLANLQLLGGAENNEKRAKLPCAWLEFAFNDAAARAEYVQRHDLGVLPEAAASFARFYDERRTAMRGRLAVLLGTPVAEVMAKAGAVA